MGPIVLESEVRHAYFLVEVVFIVCVIEVYLLKDFLIFELNVDSMTNLFGCLNFFNLLRALYFLNLLECLNFLNLLRGLFC
jgi:hypothetical protein